jgi:hypothetical protein
MLADVNLSRSVGTCLPQRGDLPGPLGNRITHGAVAFSGDRQRWLIFGQCRSHPDFRSLGEWDSSRLTAITSWIRSRQHSLGEPVHNTQLSGITGGWQ